MATTAILIDWRPRYLESPTAPSSVLLAPLGAGTVLGAQRRVLESLDVDHLIIAPRFAVTEPYIERIAAEAPGASVLPGENLRAALDGLEPSDGLLLLDARFPPLAARQLAALLEGGALLALARHVVAPRGGDGRAYERVLYDAQRCIRAVQRLHAGVTHVGPVEVVASHLPAATARSLKGLGMLHLTSLRASLAARGLPTRDLPLSAPLLDMTHETDLVDANAEAVGDGVSDLTEVAQGVWVGPGCEIHATAHVCGPVVMQAGVRIGAHAVVVGPAVLSAGVEVADGATVAYSVLGPRASVATSGPVCGRVVPAGVHAAGAAWACDGVTVATRGLTGAAHAHAEPTSGRARRPDAWRRRLFRAIKRGTDAAVAACGLVLLSPLLLAVAALVKLTSRGPIFFGHDREGRGGRVFRCWKFRTMVERAHAQQRALYQGNNVDGPQFKMARDPRVTWLGRILRATNIDELPQLYNVLRGDMSLIGPRPSPFRENQICMPWREARLSVRPGITGLWQVCRNCRSVGDFHQWIYYDILYVQHQSLALDLRILLATFLTLGGRFGVPVRWMIPAPRPAPPRRVHTGRRTASRLGPVLGADRYRHSAPSATRRPDPGGQDDAPQPATAWGRRASAACPPFKEVPAE